MQNEQLLRYGKISQLAWKFAIPSIISMVVFTLYNIVDRIFIGNIPEVGSLAMTGVGVSAPVGVVAFALAMLIGVGSSALISIKLGEKKVAEANRIFTNGLEMITLSTLALMVVVWLLLKPILRLLGADESVMQYAFDYQVILTGGFLFSSLNFFLVSCLRSIGHPQVATVCNVAGTVINLILDPLLIFGFDMGIGGAAIATIFSQFVSCAMSVFFFYWKRRELVLKVKKPNWRIDKSIAVRTMQIGFAPFAMQIANCFLLVVINNVLFNYGGNDAIAAITIMFSIQNLVVLPMIGYMQGQQPIVGFNFGAKAYSRVRSTLYYAMKVTLIFGLLGIVVVEIWPQILVRAFTNDPALVDLTVTGLRWFLGGIGFLGIKFVAGNYFQFTGNAKMATVLNLLWTVIFLPLLLVATPIWGLSAVWVGALIADLISIVISAVLFGQAMKKLPRKDEVFDKKNEAAAEDLVVEEAISPEAVILEELSGI